MSDFHAAAPPDPRCSLRHSAYASHSHARNADDMASLQEPPQATLETRRSCSPPCLASCIPCRSFSALRLDAEVASRQERQLRDILRVVCGAPRSLDSKGEGELLADRVDNEVKTFPSDVGAIEHPPLPQALVQLLGGVCVHAL